ncbi:MAG: hypothetical protein GY861_14630 [bacterium]|nr:hypothetical protein [bacterium]
MSEKELLLRMDDLQDGMLTNAEHINKLVSRLIQQEETLKKLIEFLDWHGMGKMGKPRFNEGVISIEESSDKWKEIKDGI